MSNAISFLGGMAQGGMNQWRYQDQQDRLDMAEMRQEKQDAMRAEEFEQNKQIRQGQLDDQNTERANKADQVESQKNVAAGSGAELSVNGTSTGVTDAASAQGAIDAVNAANNSLGEGEKIAVPTSEAVSYAGSGSQRKVFRGDAGLESAKSWAATQNNPDAKAEAMAAAITSQGGDGAAHLLKYNEQKEKQHAINIGIVTRESLSLLGQKNYTGFVDMYNKHYKDGRTAVYMPGAGESGSFVIYQGDPADGKKVGALSFKDGEDASQKVYQAINPATSRAEAHTLKREALSDQNDVRDFNLKEKVALATIEAHRVSAGAAANARDPLFALKKSTAVFKAAYGRDPNQDELIKLSGLAGDSHDKSDEAFAAGVVKAGVAAMSTQPAEAPALRQKLIDESAAARKASALVRKTQDAVAKPSSRTEYDKLPKGTQYMHIDGTMKVKG